MDTQNELLKEIADDEEKAVRTKAKAIIKATQLAIAKRHQWIKARQDQILKYEQIQADAYKAYDARDQSALDKVVLDGKAMKETYETYEN